MKFMNDNNFDKPNLFLQIMTIITDHKQVQPTHTINDRANAEILIFILLILLII